MNPAFDVHCFVENFRPYHESIARVTSRNAGGKGVNISRALGQSGRASRAVVIVGRDNGEEFCHTLEGEGLSLLPLWVDGRIRENITLHEQEQPETRISFEGFVCPANTLDTLRACVGEMDADTLVTLTGSIPRGIEVSRMLALLAEWRDAGARIVIDSRSVSLADLLALRPYLIKPNRDEAESYMNRSVQTVEEAAAIARELCNSGIENVIVSLGDDGAVLATRDGALHAYAPEIAVRSTVGAGDSMLAGFIDGVAAGMSWEDVSRRAVAYGTAACMREGTAPPMPEDIARLQRKITLVHLG